MTKRVLDVGQCPPDHAAICRALQSHFDVNIEQTDGTEETLAELRKRKFDLVLINRKLDRDDTDGLEIIRQIKSDPDLATTPVILVTNFDEHQDLAVQAGAARGFGKTQLAEPIIRELLAEFLA